MQAAGSGRWREVSVFIPYEQEHLSATLTYPEGVPRGMVVLMAGYGAPRSHRFQMWSRMARRLAEGHGLASIRFDYVGFGDATGLVLKWGWGEDLSTVKQAATVARVGLDMFGVDRCVAIGNCTGAATSIRLAAEMPECIGAVSLLMPMLIPEANGMKGRLRKSKAASVVRHSPFLRKYVARPLRFLSHRNQPEVADGLASVTLARARVLCLYGESDQQYSSQVRTEYDRIMSTLPEEHRARFALEVFPRARVGAFESIEVQERTTATLVEWIETCFAKEEEKNPVLEEARTT